MDEENDDQMFIDPEILKKELVISLPILNESDIEMMINGAESSEEDLSSSDDREKEKPCLKRDQRRISLLNNPNYGIILCFMEKFRSYLNIKDYPLRILEDNLISEQEKISQRFIDFHLNLLKKISSGKTIGRAQFVQNMTTFAHRFNHDDADHLEEYGYSKARVETKLRILKNLLEKQFDRNQTLKTAVADKSSFEIRSKPFGRDRFGALYWVFTDTDCFIRVFRENTDANHTWTNLVKNQEELESLIKLLITDYIVRKKYPDWKFSYESFNSLSPSSEFEEQYSLNPLDIAKKNEIMNKLNSSSILFRSSVIKTEDIDLDPIVNLDRDLSSSPPLSSFMIQSVKTKNFFDLTSDQESITSVVINGKRVISSSSSSDSKDEIYSSGCSQEVNKISKQNLLSENNDIPIITLKPSVEQGIKRKLVDYDDSESEMEDNEKNDEPSQAPPPIPSKNESKTTADLPIALRRSRRGLRPRVGELSPDSSSTGKSISQSSRRKKVHNDEWKSYNRSSKTNGRRRHSRRRRGRSSRNEHSSTTTSDDRQPSDDDDFSQDYLPNNTELDIFLNGDFLDEEDDDDDYSPRRMAKTVAKCHEQFQFASKSCSTCSQTDRPELLLLCEDCNDAYHLDCVQPELLSIPDDDWYCPICEHKHLCDGLVEKLLVLIKDQREFEMKRRLYVSKRRKRLTNVTVNLDRYVQQPTPKRQKNVIISSDTEESQKKTISINNDDDDDDDSVYGRKNDENRKPSDQKEEEEKETGKRRLRSCRQNAKSYCLDDYDKKIKEAMNDAGVQKDSIEVDSDDSDDIFLKRKPAKKRARYELDDDFDGSDGKSDVDFEPSRRRITNDDSRNNSKENYDNDDNDFNDYNDYNDHFRMSDDDDALRNRRQSSGSSIVQKKSTSKPARNNRRKTIIKSSDDSILSEANVTKSTSAVKIKSEPITEPDRHVFGTNGIVPNVFNPNAATTNVMNPNIQYAFENNNKPRRRTRAAVTKKKKPIQQENISDEEEKDRPPPPKRKPRRSRFADKDSSADNDDDDYEKLANKRRLFHHGKAITRTSITSHIKKLVGDEDDEEEDEEEEEEEGGKEKGEEAEGSTKDKPSDETKKDKNNNSKQAKTTSQYDEYQLSDDDDFPDEQEILKATRLLTLKKPPPGQKPATAVRAPFMPSMQSYQYVMADPTAHFDFTCPPEIPPTQPSDPSQTNVDNSQPTT